MKLTLLFQHCRDHSFYIAFCIYNELTAICAHRHIQACSWVDMALALGSVWVLNAFETARNARVQACSWVSMAPALGSLCLLLLGLYGFFILLKLQERTHSSLFLGLYGSCPWIAMAPALGSLWLLNASELVKTHAFKPASGSQWLLLLGLYDF